MKADWADLQGRRAARTDLASFATYVDPDQPPALHHRLLCSKLDEVAAGTLKRLMIFMPPGSAKSDYATKKFPAYYLGRHKKHGVISASYNDDLADTFGRRVRNLVASKVYRNVFNLHLAEDSKAKGEWETNEGGFYFAAGVGSGVTGRRGDLLLGDDLLKGRKEADSLTIRNSTWDWWLSDFRTRGKPGYSLVLIMTRWHEDDPAGRILPDSWSGESGWVTAKDGERWYVLCLPAQAVEGDPLGRQPGEWLWPEYLTPTHWEMTKATQTITDIRNWNSLYQQRPTVEDGTYFRREWFEGRRYTDLPESLNCYLSIDAAISEENTADFTEIPCWGVDTRNRVYAIDWWYGRKDPLAWVDAILDKAVLWNALYLVGERANIEKAVLPFLTHRMRERNIYIQVELLSTSGDKPAKCRSFQALQSAGQVYWPRVEWADRAIEQLMRFPAGKHDDVPDACGVFGRFLAQVWAAAPKPPPKLTMQQEWDRMPTMQELMGT